VTNDTVAQAPEPVLLTMITGSPIEYSDPPSTTSIVLIIPQKHLMI